MTQQTAEFFCEGRKTGIVFIVLKGHTLKTES